MRSWSFRSQLLACSGVALLVAAPAAAFGQPVFQPGLSSSELQTVYLLDASGMETSGKLLGLQPDAVVLVVDGTARRFAMTDVARIQKRDSLKNGVLIGAVVGIAMGLVGASHSDCPGSDPGGVCSGYRAAVLASSVGMYAAMGTGVDALVRGRTTIYAAPLPSGERRSRSGSMPRVAVRAGISW